MRDHYDFSKGVRGKFYRGNRHYQVTINVNPSDSKPYYQIFTTTDGAYCFRLVLGDVVLVTSVETYPTKTSCIEAIEALRHATLLAPTVEAS